MIGFFQINLQDLYIILESTATSLFVLLQLCGPAALLEQIKFEVEAIKLELHNQLLLDRGTVNIKFTTIFLSQQQFFGT